MCLCLTTSLLQTTVQPAVVKAPTLGWSQLIYAPIQRSLSENPTVFYMCFGSTSTVLGIKYSVMKRLYCLAFRLIQLSNDVVIAWIASSVKRSVTCVATTHEKQSLLGCETFSPLVPKILPLKFFFFPKYKKGKSRGTPVKSITRALHAIWTEVIDWIQPFEACVTKFHLVSFPFVHSGWHYCCCNVGYVTMNE